MVSGIVLLAAIAGLLARRYWPRREPLSSVSIRQITNIGNVENIAMSDDGRLLAEVKNDNGQRTVWVRNIATNTDAQILGPVPTAYFGLNFSPDTNYLYFSRAVSQTEPSRALYIMPIFGGAPRLLKEGVDSSISFSPDGTQFAYLHWTPDRKDRYSEISIADKNGANSRTIYTTINPAELPAWSPDGAHLAWLELTGSRKVDIKLLNLESKEVTTVAAPQGLDLHSGFQGHTYLAWLPDSRNVVALYIKPQSDRFQIGVIDTRSGAFRSLTNDVNSYIEISMSRDGRLLASVLSDIDSSVQFYPPDGGEALSTVRLRITPNALTWIDEDHLLFITRGVGITAFDRARGSMHSLELGDLAPGSYIARCPNGKVLFTASPKGDEAARLFSMNGDGSGIIQLTFEGEVRAPYCSQDSRDVMYTIRDGAQSSLWTIPLQGGTPRKLMDIGEAPRGIFSPDGRLVAATVMRDGVSKILVNDLRTGRIVHQLVADTSGNNVYERFSPSSDALMYDVTREEGSALLYQPVNGAPTRYFIAPSHETFRSFGWSPSGKQLAVQRLRTSSDVVLITDQNSSAN